MVSAILGSVKGRAFARMFVNVFKVKYEIGWKKRTCLFTRMSKLLKGDWFWIYQGSKVMICRSSVLKKKIQPRNLKYWHVKIFWQVAGVEKFWNKLQVKIQAMWKEVCMLKI